MDCPIEQPPAKIFYGWFVALGLFITAMIGPMGRYILTILFPFLTDDLNWSRQTIGFAFTLHFWAYAFIAIVVGRLVDKIGGRTIIFFGGLLMLVSLILLSRLNQVWQFYLVYGILIGTAVSMTHFVPNTSLVRKWFIKKAGLVTGLVTVGTVTGFAVLPPIISKLSVAYGWRTASFCCALGFGGTILAVAVFLIRNTPESMGLYPDGAGPLNRENTVINNNGPERPLEDMSEFTVKEALKTKNFLFFFIAYSLLGIPVQGLLGHLVVWGVELGISIEKSGMIMAALTIPSIPMRIMAGWMGDKVGKKKIFIFYNVYCVVIWISGWFFIKDSLSFLVFIILLGFAYSAPFSLFTPFLGDLFGRTIVGTLMGILTMGHGIIGGVGPLLWGWIADTMHSYQLNCLLSAFFILIIVICFYLIETPVPAAPPEH